MLVQLLLVIALASTLTYAATTDEIAQKKATLEAKASTEREEILRWDELSQSSQRKFAAAKRQVQVLRTELRINQDEAMAASNREHGAQKKLTELDQLSCQLKNKLDEQYQHKLVLERKIAMRSRKRKRSVKRKRQTLYHSDPAVKYHADYQRSATPQTDRNPNNFTRRAEPRPLISSSVSNTKPREAVKQNTGKILEGSNQRGNEIDMKAELDLSKMSDIEMLRKSLGPAYGPTIDSIARQTVKNPMEDPVKKEVVPIPRKEVVGGYSGNVGAGSSTSTRVGQEKPPAQRSSCGGELKAGELKAGELKAGEQKAGEQKADGDDQAELRKVKTQIFQDEALLTNVGEQLEAARATLAAERNRLDEIMRKIVSVRYEVKDAEREAHEKLEALKQEQWQRAAHEDVLTDITKQLQAIAVEAMQVEMEDLSKINGNTEQKVRKRSVPC